MATGSTKCLFAFIWGFPSFQKQRLAPLVIIVANLLTYMDGKSGAEELINKVLQDPALLASLAAQPAGDDGKGK